MSLRSEGSTNPSQLGRRRRRKGDESSLLVELESDGAEEETLKLNESRSLETEENWDRRGERSSDNNQVEPV